MRAKNFSLENDDVVVVEPVGQESEDSDQLELMELEASVQNTAVESDTVSMVMESLAGYICKLEELIEDKTATLQTVDIIETAARDQLARVGEKLDLPAMEAEGDVYARHQLVLESVQGALKRIIQSYVVGFKHSWNAIADFFKTFDQRLRKYEAKIDTTEAELVRKKSRLSDKMVYKGNMVELWYHYVRKPGAIQPGTTKFEDWGVKNPVEVTKEDVQMSDYLLTVYPKKVLAELKLLDGVLRGARIKTVDDIGKLAEKVERLHHPMELYDQKKLGEGLLLSAVELEEDHGTVRQPVTLGKKVHQRLSELATPSVVIESTIGLHTANKVAMWALRNIPFTKIGAGIISMMLPNGYTFRAAEIGDLLKCAREYIANIKEFQKMISDSDSMINGIGDHLEVIGDQIDAAQFSGQDLREIGAVVRQIDMYAENLVAGVFSPAIKELSRSLKCVKYSNYLALRMLSAST